MKHPDNEADDWTGSDFKFDYIAQNIFFPIYDIIADDILARTQSTEGKLIDIGCGGGHLGLSLMKKTHHKGYFVDVNETALKIARDRAEEWGLADRAVFIRQDVHEMDFQNDFADLIISRGSYIFWKDIEKAFLKIYREQKMMQKHLIDSEIINSEEMGRWIILHK